MADDPINTDYEPSTTEELLSEVSDYWNTVEGSNLYKLVDSFNEPLSEMGDNANLIERWREITEAGGTTLDLMGDDCKTYRTSDDDDLYRFLIYIHYLLSEAQGTIPSIVKITQSALGKKAGVEIEKTTPHHMSIKVCFDSVKNQEMQKLIIKYMQKMLALGYWLDVIVFYSPTHAQGYIGAGTVDHEESKNVSTAKWWTGWKSKTAGMQYGATVTNAFKYGRNHEDAVWWTDPHDAKSEMQVSIGAVLKIEDKEILN